MPYAKPRAQLAILAQRAVPLRDKGASLRLIAALLDTNAPRVLRALRAISHPSIDKPRKERRGEVAELIRDGTRALELRKAGHSIETVLMAIGGSRPRLYRAMRRAQESQLDSLLK
jgi:methionyl-tRNA formyltransferase